MSTKEPIMRYIKGKEFWHTMREDGSPCLLHKLDAKAVLDGLMSGVVIHIYPPAEAE